MRCQAQHAPTEVSVPLCLPHRALVQRDTVHVGKATFRLQLRPNEPQLGHHCMPVCTGCCEARRQSRCQCNPSYLLSGCAAAVSNMPEQKTHTTKTPG